MTDERMFSILDHTTEGETMTCNTDCVMCRYDRHVPAEPSGPTILEGAVIGFGLAASAWVSGWIIYRLGVWIERLDFGTGSFIWATTVGAFVAAWSVLRERR